MDFQQTLEDLYGLQRFGIKLGLENIRTLLERLGNPQAHFACVHVAGTNGKGSVSAYLAEILHHADIPVGLYTSPHLHCLTERIRINREPVSKKTLCQLAEDVKAASLGLPVTFFEALTAMALLAFQRSGVDVAVLETGLGGRLDATNVVTPVLSLITPIGLDHQEHLGDDLATIAAEKAGIIKPEVPVVVGRQFPEAQRVLLERARQLAAPACLAGRDFECVGQGSSRTVRLGDKIVTGLTTRLAGEHQWDNMAQAVVAALKLAEQGWLLDAEVCRQAGRSVTWPGRLEWWPGNPAILFDAAHNQAGFAALKAFLECHGIKGMPLLVGLSRGRRPDQVLKALAGIAGDVYAVPVDTGESVAPADIVAWAEQAGLRAYGFATAEAGFRAALAACPVGGPLVVCGSIFLVAAVRELLGAMASYSGPADFVDMLDGALP